MEVSHANSLAALKAELDTVKDEVTKQAQLSEAVNEDWVKSIQKLKCENDLRVLISSAYEYFQFIAKRCFCYHRNLIAFNQRESCF